MSQRLLVIPALLIMAMTGCDPTPPRWRQEALVTLDSARVGGADKAFPAEYGSAQETFARGEALLLNTEVENAEACFRFAWMKGELLEIESAAEKARRAEEARLRLEDERLELERRQLLEMEQPRVALEKTEAPELKSKHEKVKPSKERPLPAYHTVKRGETLPQIAAQADVYNDYRLWPLLYRANRDQIRDPRNIWPGQVLRIPRHPSREEITEARRYALEKPF